MFKVQYNGFTGTVSAINQPSAMAQFKWVVDNYKDVLDNAEFRAYLDAEFSVVVEPVPVGAGVAGE